MLVISKSQGSNKENTSPLPVIYFLITGYLQANTKGNEEVMWELQENYWQVI